jgi:sugar phosphate isomerase/epimerase
MRISLSTGSLFRLPLHKICELSSLAGFDGIELIINQVFEGINSSRLIASLQEITTIHSIHAPFMPLAGWGGPADSLRISIELAAERSIPLVNFHPPSWAGFEVGFWRWLYSVRDFQKEVGRDGQVVVTLENMPWVGKYKINPNILSNTQRMIDFIDEHNLFMTFDCTHMGSGNADFIHDFYMFYESGRIRNIHFSDYGNGREHLLPGHGILPLTRFLNHLRSTDYQSTVTLEIDPAEFPKSEANILESLKEMLAFLRTETGKDSGQVRAFDQQFRSVPVQGS